MLLLKLKLNFHRNFFSFTQYYFQRYCVECILQDVDNDVVLWFISRIVCTEENRKNICNLYINTVKEILHLRFFYQDNDISIMTDLEKKF